MDALCLKASEIHHPLLPAVKMDPKEGITPDQAALIAVVANPSLRALRDQRASAQAAVLQAKLLPNPQLVSNYDFITGGNTAGAVNAYGWGLGYDVSSLIAHDANLRAAEANNASVDLSVAWQEWQTAEAAKQAVYDLLSLQAQVRTAEEIHQHLLDNLNRVRQGANAHLQTSIDLSAAQAAEEEARMTLLQAQRDAEHQRLALNRALGVPANTTIRLKKNMSLPSAFSAPPETELLDSLDQRRLDLVALRYGYASQEQILRAAVLNQFPKVNLQFNRTFDNTGVHMAGPGVTIELPIFDDNQATIAAEKATRQRLFDEYLNRVFEARSDIAAALSDLRSLNSQIADAQAALKGLEQLLNTYRQAFSQGNADAISYYTAWNNLTQKRMEVLKLQQQLADTKIALELASGRYFPDTPAATSPVAVGSVNQEAQ